MKNSFLYQIAKVYSAQNEVDLRRCLFVFPSRRSSLFFQKYMGQCSSKPLFSPDIITIGDLFARLSDLRRGDKIELLYILWTQYSAICRDRGRESEGFDEFVSLGETVLADFNDVDKYLADHAKLFTLIGDLRELDSGYDFLSEEQKDALRRFWGVIVSGKESEQKAKFLGMWSILDELYTAFRSALLRRGIAYEGMLQRQVAERLMSDDASLAPSFLAGYERVVVVGQNALCKCEMVLLDYLRREADGDFYWDYFGECLRDPANKASHFIKGYLEKYPSKYKIEAEAAGRPQIKVIAASSAVAQAKVAAAELVMAGEDSTAVVLPDENLLMPLLNSIPEAIRHINVTMGYGLHNSATASLMDMLASLQINRREGRGFYHKDVLAILNHPFVRNFSPENVLQLKTDIVKSNMIYVRDEMFAGDEILGLLFTPRADATGVASWQLECLNSIAPSLSGIECEFAHGYFTSVSHLRDLNIPMSMKTYFRFLREVTSRLTVDFRGEPLSGLQVMGPLEVRAIDFETIVILSVNEGVFPAKSVSDSLIPYNVRRGFGLPTVELFDSISAYHFYRSIYRAKKVVLIYDSRTKGLLSGEESRFVKQLRYHYHFPMEPGSVDLEIKPVEGAVRTVAKTDEILARMRSLFLEGGEGNQYLSASSLNDYLDCRLKFYYKHVAGLKEEDEVTEDVDAGQFGNTFHHTMEAVYERLGRGAIVTKDVLNGLIKEKGFVEGLVARFLNRELKQADDAPLGRRNQITANLVAEMVRTTLRRDCDYAPFIYVASEKQMLNSIGINVSGVNSKVRLKGFIDRLDRKEGGHLRICDYKTGSVKEVSSYLDESCLEKVFEGEKKTSFQMLVYAMLLSMEKDSGKEFNLAVYQVRNLYSQGVESKYCPKETIEAFGGRLKGLIEEIFEKSVAFDSVETGSKTCEYCPAKAICGR